MTSQEKQQGNKSARPKIVLVGGFGWRDIGDEAMPEAVILNLRKTIPNLDIVMLSPNPDYTREYHGERAIHDVSRYLNRRPRLVGLLGSRKLGFVGRIFDRLLLRGVLYWSRWLYFIMAARLRRHGIHIPLHEHGASIVTELETSDLLFNNGGGNINSVLPAELAKQTLMLLAASALGKPSIISGQTIGPIYGVFHKWIAGTALNCANMLTFRDKEVSMARVKEIGVTNPVMRDTSDDAVSLMPPDKQQIERLVRQNDGDRWLSTKASITVAVNMNAYLTAMGKSDVSEYQPEIELMAEVTKRLIREYDARLVFLPTDYGHGADDRVLHRWLASRIANSDQILLIEREHKAAELKGILALADLAIGSRYHFCVFALSSGVPCIGMANGIYQKTKLKGVADLFGVPECVFEEDMCSLTFDCVWNSVQQIMAERENLAGNLRRRAERIRSDSLSTIRKARDMLV